MDLWYCIYFSVILASIFFVFLGLHLQHVEVPRLGVKLELQLLAYSTATATKDPSCICDLHHRSLQCWILNPLSEARDRTCTLMDTIQACYYSVMTGTPWFSIFIDYIPYEVALKYWLYFLCYVLHPCEFYYWQFVLFNPPHLFHLFPSSPLYFSPLRNHYFILWICKCVCFVIFSPLFFILDSTYKWKSDVPFSVWLLSLSIILSRSIHVVTNGKILFFFYGWIGTSQRSHTDCPQAHEKIGNIINHKRKATQTRVKYHLPPVRKGSSERQEVISGLLRVQRKGSTSTQLVGV